MTEKKGRSNNSRGTNEVIGSAHHDVKIQDGLHDEREQQHCSGGQHQHASPRRQPDPEGTAQVRRAHAQVNEGSKLRELRQAVHNVQQLHDLRAQGNRVSEPAATVILYPKPSREGPSQPAVI